MFIYVSAGYKIFGIYERAPFAIFQYGIPKTMQ